MKLLPLLVLITSCSTFLCTSCDQDQITPEPENCVPAGIQAIASGEFIDIEDGPTCFFATEIDRVYLHYRLNQDGNTGLELPLIPWSSLYLDIGFRGEDELTSDFSVRLRNSILDSVEAFNSPPVPLTAELIVDRLMTPGTYPINGRGINGRGYDATIQFTNARFGGYSYNGYQMPPDAGSVSILSSELRTEADGEQFIDLELTFDVLIRQYYDQNSWRQLQNGLVNVSMPVADIIPQ